MIRYLTHKEIDKQAWNDCVSKSLNTLIYGYSWYLDEAAPGWDALVLDDYEAVFPIIHTKKYFINYLYQPLFTQQLGLFYTNTLAAEMMEDFILSIPEKYKFIDISLNDANWFVSEKYALIKRKNYVLDLFKPYAKLSKNYSESLKRNINKAKSSGLKIVPAQVDEIISMYIKNKGADTAKVTAKDYNRLKKIIVAVKQHDMLKTYAVADDDNKIVAGALFSFFNKRLIYLLGSSSNFGREKSAMHFLLDHLILIHSDQNILLDFEGSEISGVAKFFKSFGSEKLPYYKLHINRLPFIFKWLKK